MDIEEKQIWFFKEKYMKEQIDKIKRAFKSKCLEDNTLSDDYKNYVSDLDNILVGFKPVYGFDMDARFKWVEASYIFEYTYTYQSGQHLSGTVSVNSDGRADTSGLKIVNDYSSGRSKCNGTCTEFASATAPIRARVGAAVDKGYDVENYIDISSCSDEELKSVSSEYYEYVNKKIHKEDFAPYVKLSMFPSSLRERLEAKAKRGYANDIVKNTFFMGVYDFSISECSIIYMPYDYTFDVGCVFEGEEYALYDVSSIYNIKAVGPKSEHYNYYVEQKKDADKRYWKYQGPIKWQYIANIILVALIAVALIVFKLTANKFNLTAVYENPPGPVLISVAIAVGLGLFNFIGTARSEDMGLEDSFYDASLSKTELKMKLEKKLKNQKILQRTIVTAWSVISVAYAAVIIFFTAQFAINTYSEHYYYTPEVLQSYSGNEDDEFTRITIVSCDEDGNVVIEVEKMCSDSNGNSHYYGKFRLTGIIDSKTVPGLGIKLNEEREWIYLTESDARHFYATENESRIHIKENYSIIDDYNSFDLYSNSNCVIEEKLKSSKIVGEYKRTVSGREKIIKINGCNPDGTIYGVYKEITRYGYLERELSGRVVAQTNREDSYIEFVLGDYICKEIEMGTKLEGSITGGFCKGDYSELRFNEDEYKKSNN